MLDIAGACLIWRFGIPGKYNEEGVKPAIIYHAEG